MTVNISKPAVNVREKLAELDKPTGIAGEAMLRAETPQEQFNLIGAGRRNWIINGDFQVSQRGDFTTASSASDLGYSVDRFKNFVKIVTADVLHTKAATVNGEIKNTLKMTATSTASGRFGFRQYIESGSNGKTVLAGKTVTMSVWMRSNHPDAGFYFYDYGNAGYFYRVKHSGSGEWEKLTLTFPTATGNVTSNYYGYELNFTIQNNSNGVVSVTSGDYVEIAEPQLELGKVATPFEHRSYGEELALCQRYYQVLIDAAAGQRPVAAARANSTSTLEFHLPLTVGMRDITSLPQSNMGTVYIYTDSARVNTTSATIVLNDDYRVGSSYAYLRITGASVADDRAYTIAGYEASAFLAVDGEL